MKLVALVLFIKNNYQNFILLMIKVEIDIKSNFLFHFQVPVHSTFYVCHLGLLVKKKRENCVE